MEPKTNNHGRLIVIEGLDGSGKATQSRLLTDALARQGLLVRQVSFPCYESDSSALIKMYLRGDFGSDPEDVNAYAASAFFAVDRYASYKSDWQDFYCSGGVVIADRYTTSNAIHQCSKLPEEAWDDYLDWLFTFEYGHLGIPSPDQVIYLASEVAVSQRLLMERYHGEDSKRDIHERDLTYLERSQRAAEYCAKKLGWTRISCVESEAFRTIEEIHDEVLRALKL